MPEDEDKTKEVALPERENEYGYRVVTNQVEEYPEMMRNMTEGGWTAIQSFQDFSLKGQPWNYFFARRKSAESTKTG